MRGIQTFKHMFLVMWGMGNNLYIIYMEDEYADMYVVFCCAVHGYVCVHANDMPLE